MLKITFQKNKPLEINYRKYKFFDEIAFNEDLKFAFDKNEILNCEQFEETIMKTLNQHPPLKKKVLRANNAPYITKKLRKAIMKRSQLEKIYLKNLTDKTLNCIKNKRIM